LILVIGYIINHSLSNKPIPDELHIQWDRFQL